MDIGYWEIGYWYKLNIVSNLPVNAAADCQLSNNQFPNNQFPKLLP